MAITVGSASGSTGLAGRIRAALDTLFAAVTRDFSAGSVGDKGTNAYAQGLVDALNNDKVGVDQRDAKAIARSAGNFGGLTITSASGWTDLPGSSLTYSGTSDARRVWIRVSFSYFVSLASTQMQVRILVDGVQKDGTLSFFRNTASDHAPFAFTFDIASGFKAGSPHTIKAQVQVVTGGGAQMVQDANDYCCMTAEEVG